MLRKLNWQGFTNDNRHLIIEQIKAAINACDAYIVNFNLYSELSLNLSVVVEGKSIAQLFTSLTPILSMSEQDPGQFDTKASREWTVFVNITFGAGKGDLKSDVPNIPG